MLAAGQRGCKQEVQVPIADSEFLEAIRSNIMALLINQSNLSPHAPQILQIYFCLTFPSISLSTCAFVVMETSD